MSMASEKKNNTKTTEKTNTTPIIEIYSPMNGARALPQKMSIIDE
jgi:hypothetical protein